MYIVIDLQDLVFQNQDISLTFYFDLIFNFDFSRLLKKTQRKLHSY